MSKSQTTIPQNRSVDIPFNQLVLSQANVRQTKTGVSLEELREDIAVRGILQSLSIRPILGEDGKETGQYEVPAGGRRFRALEQLVKAKRLPKTALIPCVIRETAATTSREDDSMAENVHRLSLHPLDQYRGFLALRRQNMTEEEIAARYFVSVSVVKQRLRLASVSPSLLQQYADEAMTLEQLMAFSVTGDHGRQEQLWDLIKEGQSYLRDPYHIRRQLTDAAVEATDRRAQFIGIEAYEAAGGEVLRDLFHLDNGGWLQDPVMLDRLANEKLADAGQSVAGEGWQWVEVLLSVPFDHFHDLERLEPQMADLNERDSAALSAAKSEYEALSIEFEGWEEVPEEVDERFAVLEREIERVEALANPTFAPEDKAKAGAVVTIDRNGKLLIQRGFVRTVCETPTLSGMLDDEDSHALGEGTPAVITIGGGDRLAPAVEPAPEEEGETIRPMPEKLVLELSAFRTAALRDAVAGNSRVAMTLLLHRLVGDAFRPRSEGTCLQAFISPPQLLGIAQGDLGESIPAISMDERRARLAAQLPVNGEDLWAWLDAATDDLRAELLAFCVSFGVNALVERPNPFGAGPTERTIRDRLAMADRVTAATGLDLIEAGWRPTATSYLARVPKPRILEAVREGCGERAAQLIDHLKKGDMVVEAERLLADTGWLPEPLRGPDVAVSLPEPDVDLPAFLDDDQGQIEVVSPIAAE